MRVSLLCIPRAEEGEQSRPRRAFLGSLSSVPLSPVFLQGFSFTHFANAFCSKGFISTKCGTPFDQPSVESRRLRLAPATTIRVVVLYWWLVSRKKTRDHGLLMISTRFRTSSKIVKIADMRSKIDESKMRLPVRV
jgi:hypothetical protein